MHDHNWERVPTPLLLEKVCRTSLDYIQKDNGPPVKHKNTDRNGVNEQNARAHTHTPRRER